MSIDVILVTRVLGFVTAMMVSFLPESSRAQERVEENVVYGMVSGLALLMDVYEPERPNGRGVIVVYGNSWAGPTSYDARQLKRLGAPAVLTDAGFTVFVVNHRVAPRFLYPAAVEDVQRAVRFIRHHADRYRIDPDRIGAFGASSGGHLASLLGVLDGDGDPTDPDPVNRLSAKVQAVAAHSAPVDFTHRDYRANGPERFLGLPPTPEFMPTYREASPITHVTPDDPPFSFVHGDADFIVPIHTVEPMHRALVENGVPAEFRRVAGRGHEIAPDWVSVGRWLTEHLLEEAQVEALEPVFERHETLGESVEWARQGRIPEAVAVFAEVQSGESGITIDYLAWGRLCTNGSLWGYAIDVMTACESAVALSPEPSNAWARSRESRGIARALTGDYQGAIEDLQAFAVQTPSEEARAQRRAWIDALRAGENPFSPEVLEALRSR